MTAINGFKLTFDDSTVFRATENIDVAHRTQPLYLIDGLNNFVTLYNEYIEQGGQPGRSDSNYSGVFYGFGAGIHTIEIGIYQYEGNTETWGSASAGDAAITKLQELNHAITTKRADSEAPALLEVGEYNSSSGNFSPIPVAIGETSLPYPVGPDVQTLSAFDGQMTFYDAIDVGQAVDAIFRE